MNCRNCGQPLNGATVCPNCGTSIGYVVNNPAGVELGTPNNNSNGYVQNNAQTGYVQNNNSNGYVPNNIPAGFGFGVVEPSDGAFNKNYGGDGSVNLVDSINGNNSQNSTKKTAKLFKKGTKKTKGFKPINKVAEEVELATGAPTLVNFGTTNYSENNDEALLARAGTMSKDMLIEQMNGTNADGSARRKSDGWSMELPDDKKTTKFWLILGIIILLIIIIGVYILPLFTDINYSKYEQDNFVIKYKKDWVSREDEKTKKTSFIYRDTSYKIIINGVSAYSDMKFDINTLDDRKVLYKAFYDSWRNVSGGKLNGGSDTFLDLEEDGSMYAKIDYILDDNKGVGSFYVVLCEKYDVVLSFMTFCAEQDKEVFEKEVLEFINGIDYVGLTALEKEQKKYEYFEAKNVKQYVAGSLITYEIPDAWKFDSLRTSSVNNQYNIYQFMDEMSLLEVKAFPGRYTYESMKESVISNFGAIKTEGKKTINGKVWYVIITPDYNSGGYSYHNELYFTMSVNNNYIYYVQTYLFNETSNDSVKRKYFDDSIKYVLENMTLHNVNN